MSLMEKGDIGCAVELLLLVQGLYARQEPQVTRGMRDVAYRALELEIDKYVDGCEKKYRVGVMGPTQNGPTLKETLQHASNL